MASGAALGLVQRSWNKGSQLTPDRFHGSRVPPGKTGMYPSHNYQGRFPRFQPPRMSGGVYLSRYLFTAQQTGGSIPRPTFPLLRFRSVSLPSCVIGQPLPYRQGVRFMGVSHETNCFGPVGILERNAAPVFDLGLLTEDSRAAATW